jgi:hypothetical protein
MKTARFVKNINDFKGVAKLYQTDDGYIVVSAANVPFSGPETYIFESDSNGNITNWMELEGSYQGGLSHDKALEGGGYVLI